MNSDVKVDSDSAGASDHPMAQALFGTVMKRALMVTAGAGMLGVMARKAQAVTAPGYTAVSAYFNTLPQNGSIQIPGTGDIKVLNYALALEDLEASLYRQALLRLTTGGTSDTGQAITGLGVTSGDDFSYISEFGQVETDHATFLRAAINGAGGPVIPVFKYEFNLNSLSRVQLLELVYAAELTGVSAYTGAVPYFASKDYLPVAAAILGTEARHTAVIAAILNSSLFNVTVSTSPQYNENSGKDTPLTPDQILNQGGTVSNSVTVARDGHIAPVTGDNGFVFTPNAA